MNRWVTSLLVLMMSTVVFAQNSGIKPARNGSGSSGGGDEDGISKVSLRLKRLARNISMMGEDLIASKEKRELIQTIATTASVFITDDELPVSVLNGRTLQKGMAYSEAEGAVYNVMANRERLLKEEDEAILDLVFVHELFVLVGLEKTGEYRYTNKYDDLVRNHWKVLSGKRDQVVCTVTAYRKGFDHYTDRSATPALKEYTKKNISTELGHLSFINNIMGTSSEGQIIFMLNKKRAVGIRMIYDTVGFMKAQIFEGDADFIYRNEKEMVPFQTIYSPYAEEKSVPNEPTFIEHNRIFYLFSCAWRQK